MRPAGGTGLGYSYAEPSAAGLAANELAKALHGRAGVLGADAAGSAQHGAVPGIAATAVSAVDAALWDLKGKLLGLPLATLLGRCRAEVPIYGSGGFTTYSDGRCESSCRAGCSGTAAAQ